MIYRRIIARDGKTYVRVSGQWREFIELESGRVDGLVFKDGYVLGDNAIIADYIGNDGKFTQRPVGWAAGVQVFQVAPGGYLVFNQVTGWLQMPSLTNEEICRTRKHAANQVGDKFSDVRSKLDQLFSSM